MKTTSKTLTLLALISAVCSAQALTTQYNLYALPVLPGGTYGAAYGINNWGDVAGIADNASGKVRGFFYNGMMQTIAPALLGNNSRAYDLNDNRIVVGYRDRYNAPTNSMKSQAFIWDAAQGTITDIGNFAAAPNFESVGNAINSSNVVAGGANGMQGSTTMNPLRWTAGGGCDWVGTYSGLTNSFGHTTGISDNGKICGYSNDINGNVRPFRTYNGVLTQMNGMFLGAGIYADTWARDINNNAVFVGEFRESTGVFRAFRYGASGYVSMGKLSGAGAVSEDSSGCFGINMRGDIVGYSEIGNGNYHAFAALSETSNTLKDLNTYLPAGSPWVLQFAYDINDYGVICGTGRLNGELRGFVLRPVSKIMGTITLKNWQQSLAGREVTIEIYDDATNTLLESRQVTLSATGAYTHETDKVGPGRRVSVKDSHWLRKTRVISLNTNGWLGIDFNLTNGDADGDNEVTIVDYAQVSASFGKSLGEFGYDANADLDGDEEISLLDISIVSAEFGKMGDE